tara:strand:- start:536 stop:676 length:141 start_codon:yes stop_codon:yes gene_type:complete
MALAYFKHFLNFMNLLPLSDSKPDFANSDLRQKQHTTHTLAALTPT